MARPRDGKEVKQVHSIKLEPRTHKKIIKKYKTLAAFIKEAVKEKIK